MQWLMLTSLLNVSYLPMNKQIYSSFIYDYLNFF